MIKLSLTALTLFCLGASIDAFLLKSTPQLGSRHCISTCRGKPSYQNVGAKLRKSAVSIAMAAGGPVAEESGFLKHPLAELLAECKDFGLVRFISVNPTGSVLETAGKLRSRHTRLQSNTIRSINDETILHPLKQRVWTLGSRASTFRGKASESQLPQFEDTESENSHSLRAHINFAQEL
jgi:hypothetical protein